MRWRMATAAVAAMLMAAGLAGAAAQFQRRGGRRPFGERALRYATLDDYDGSFQFCRVVFRQASNGDGGELERRLPARRREPVDSALRADQDTGRHGRDGMPKHLLISLTDPTVLSHCPFIMMTEVGSIYLDDSRSRRNCATTCSRADFSGPTTSGATAPGTSSRARSGRCCPRARYPIVDLPLDHPIFHAHDDAAPHSADSVDQLLGRPRRPDLGARRRQRHAARTRASSTSTAA